MLHDWIIPLGYLAACGAFNAWYFGPRQRAEARRALHLAKRQARAAARYFDKAMADADALPE